MGMEEIKALPNPRGAAGAATGTEQRVPVPGLLSTVSHPCPLQTRNLGPEEPLPRLVFPSSSQFLDPEQPTVRALVPCCLAAEPCAGLSQALSSDPAQGSAALPLCRSAALLLCCSAALRCGGKGFPLPLSISKQLQLQQRILPGAWGSSPGQPLLLSMSL